MGSPYEHRELMCAAFQFGTTKTVEEVVAEQKARHEEADRERQASKPFKKGAAPRAAPKPRSGVPAASEVAKVRALLAQHQGPKPAEPPPAE